MRNSLEQLSVNSRARREETNVRGQDCLEAANGPLTEEQARRSLETNLKEKELWRIYERSHFYPDGEYANEELLF